jgi:hypothetical protein
MAPLAHTSVGGRRSKKHGSKKHRKSHRRRTHRNKSAKKFFGLFGGNAPPSVKSQ